MNVKRLLWIGGACLFTGWALVFLTVVRILPSSFTLAFIAIALLIIGTVAGFYGLYTIIAANLRRSD